MGFQTVLRGRELCYEETRMNFYHSDPNFVNTARGLSDGLDYPEIVANGVPNSFAPKSISLCSRAGGFDVQLS